MVDFRNAIESLPIWQEWLNSGDIQSSISNTTQEIDSFVPRNDSNIEFSISSKLSPNLPRFQDSKLFPILCGGTGLYIDGLIYNMEYPDTPPDWEYREALERIRIHEGNQILWNMLEVVDPDYAHELNVNNFRYVMRGLEVIRATGKSKRESHGKKKPRFSPLFLTPYVDNDRGELYTRIDKRVELMFKN